MVKIGGLSGCISLVRSVHFFVLPLVVAVVVLPDPFVVALPFAIASHTLRYSWIRNLDLIIKAPTIAVPKRVDISGASNQHLGFNLRNYRPTRYIESRKGDGDNHQSILPRTWLGNQSAPFQLHIQPETTEVEEGFFHRKLAHDQRLDDEPRSVVNRG